ncbi:hypothetical protein QN277_010468 [Acacia crassicarpa]|uniref:Uncharacterized protein n=1 Tax=Acacia crassicarpa TaxID=499986 RepID=A0AAE1IP79_9FABA|nr:hypothetical protein QN277_010468 [Acacia crassicarpa]
MAFMAQPQVSPFATSSNISSLPVVAPLQANPGTTYQPQQQQMLMNPTNPQQMGHRASFVNSGSRSMQIPPRLRPEADKINMK